MCVCGILGDAIWLVSPRWLRHPIRGGLSYQQSVLRYRLLLRSSQYELLLLEWWWVLWGYKLRLIFDTKGMLTP